MLSQVEIGSWAWVPVFVYFAFIMLSPNAHIFQDYGNSKSKTTAGYSWCLEEKECSDVPGRPTSLGHQPWSQRASTELSRLTCRPSGEGELSKSVTRECGQLGHLLLGPSCHRWWSVLELVSGGEVAACSLGRCRPGHRAGGRSKVTVSDQGSGLPLGLGTQSNLQRRALGPT